MARSEKTWSKFSSSELVNLVLQKILCLVHDILVFKFNEKLDLILLSVGFGDGFGAFKRINSPNRGPIVKRIYTMSSLAFPLLFEGPSHFVKINLLNFDRKHMLQILSYRSAASGRFQNLRSPYKTLFNLDCCARVDFTLRHETKIYDSLWLTLLIRVHLLNHAVLHHIEQI